MARTMAWSTWSGAARSDDEGRPESLQSSARSKVAAAGDLLREGWGKGHYKMRRDKGERMDHKRAALAHRLVDGKLTTAAVWSNFGEL